MADGLRKVVVTCLWLSWLNVQLEGGAVSTKDLQDIHTHHHHPSNDVLAGQLQCTFKTLKSLRYICRI